MRFRGALLLAVAAVGTSLAAPSLARAAVASEVVMYSESGDYIGGGQNRVYHPGNAKLSVSGNASYLTVGVSGGQFGDSFSLDFAAPPGQALAPGVYDRAQRAPFREATRPGIDISGDGRGCNEDSGRFEVKDIATAPDGSIQRLWIVYEQHCEGGVPALFGEVRLNEPDGDAQSFTAPAVVRWPVGNLGQAGMVVPVTVLATGATQFGAASVAGANPGDFPLRLDDCGGHALGAGATCEVWVRFTPTAPGTRTAVLRIPDAAGRVHEVALNGFTYGGRTRLVMNSDSGDYIGGGRSYSYTPESSTIAAGGTRRGVSFGVRAPGSVYWDGSFSPADGDIIAPGRYTGATRDPFRGTGPGIEITGNGRGCNQIAGEFTVNEATFEQDGRLRTVSIDFEQHCEGGTPALRGTFEYRAGDTTPPAPWMDQPPPNNPAPPTGPTQQQQSSPTTQPTQRSGPAVPGKCGAKRFASLAVLAGTAKADRLKGTAAGEILLGASGNDVLLARAGDDCLDGGKGRDALSGGAGADHLYGGAGNDRLDGGPGKDRLDCGPGRDTATVTKGDRVRGCERVVHARATK